MGNERNKTLSFQVRDDKQNNNYTEKHLANLKYKYKKEQQQKRGKI